MVMQEKIKKALQYRWFNLFVITVVVLGLSLSGVFAKEASALIDINSASQKELEGLNGVGAATAKKIIDNRPYKSADELSKAGLSATSIKALKPFITAGPAAAVQPPKTEAKPAPAAKVAEKAAEAKAPAGLVDLNTADQKALEALPGVGPKTAQEIIKGRPYNSVDDLSKVKGIDKGKMGTLKGLVTVSAPKAATPAAPPAPVAATKGVTATKASEAASKAASTKLAPGEKININTASKEQIEKLPGIGPVKAQAIIAGRPYNSVEDVKKVKGIKEGSFSKIKDLITVK
jgi:competence protein ComEA